MIRQAAGNRLGNQLTWITALVRPKIDVDHDNAMVDQGRSQIVLQEHRFARPAGSRKEQAVLCVPKGSLAFQLVSQLCGEPRTGEVGHPHYPELFYGS